MTASAQPPIGLTPLARLALALGLAAEVYDPGSEDGGRISVLMSLRAVDDFLMANFGSTTPSLLVPLRQLQYALHGLGRGNVEPMMAPKKVAHRPRGSPAIEAFRALAAVAMDLLVLAGVARKQAARDVARELSRMGYTDGPGKVITGERVEDWRDRVMQEWPAESEAAARFQRMKAQLEARFPSDRKAAARFLLGRLPLVVPIPKKAPS